jgi:hypothetical protein
MKTEDFPVLVKYRAGRESSSTPPLEISFANGLAYNSFLEGCLRAGRTIESVRSTRGLMKYPTLWTSEVSPGIEHVALEQPFWHNAVFWGLVFLGIMSITVTLTTSMYLHLQCP